jgi:hypothetical protein
MNKGSRYIIFTIFSSLLFSFAFAQNPIVSVKTDREQILIGEPIILTLEASFPPGVDQLWFNTDTIPHFDVITKGKIDTLKGTANAEFRQNITITSFDSGRWTIPPFLIELNGRQYLTDSLAIDVSYSPMDPKQDYHDIHEIIEVDNPDTQYLTWITAAILGVTLLMTAFFLSRKWAFARAAEPPPPPPPLLPPLEEAMKRLDELQHQQVTEKQYFTQLNDILRNFLQRKNVAVEGKTNSEIGLRLQQARLHRDELAKLMQALRMADAVKFAKFQPTGEERAETFQIIKEAIQSFDRTLTS